MPCAVLTASRHCRRRRRQVVDEVKIGGLAHDVGFLTHHVETGADVNLEMLFTSPDVPRDHRLAAAAYRWRHQHQRHDQRRLFRADLGRSTLVQGLFDPGDGIFVNGSLGGAIQDGYIDTAPPGRKRLGSRILFRESAELGYQITPTVSVSAMLDHISNADLGQHNAGITSAGARFGFKF